MKKILFILLIFVSFNICVNALEKTELSIVKEKLLNDGVYLDTRLYDNSMNWKNDLQNKLNEEVKKISDNLKIYLRKYTYSSCDVTLKYYNENKIIEIIDIENIPIKLTGFIFNDDNLILKVKDTIEISPILIDEKNKINYKVQIDYYDDYSKNIVSIDNNTIKANNSGFATLKIIIESEKDNWFYRINVFVEFQNYINNKINKINTLELDRGIYGTNYDKLVYDYLLNDKYYSSKISNTICSNDICNIDFKIFFRDYEYHIKKESIKFKNVGIVLNELSNKIVLNVGEEYKIDYKLYSDNINWYSDTSVATITDDGIINAVSEGICLIVANTNDNNTIVLIVEVRSDDNKIEKKLNQLLADLIGDNKTIYIPFVSCKNDIIFKRYLYDYLSSVLLEISDDKNINLLYEYDESLKDYIKLRTIKIGLNYMFDLNYTDSDNAIHYYDGDYVSTEMIEVKLIFEDDKSDFNNKLLDEAISLINKIVNKKTFNTYLNTSIKYYNEDINGLLLKNIYFNIDHNFIINFYPIEYNESYINGYVSVSKDGIIYASSNEMIMVKNVIKIIRDKKLSEDEIISYIENEIRDSLKNKDTIIKVSKYDKDIYNINIDDEIELKTYVEFIDLKVTNKPNININKGNDNSLIIEYDKVEYANEYDIYRSNSKNGKYKKIASTENNKYIDEKLIYGKTYYYKMIAKNDISKSEYSNIVSMKVLPNKVNNIKSNINTNDIILSWDKVNASGYVIYRSTDNKKWSKIKTINKSNVLSYNDKGLIANKTYYYKIRSFDKEIYGSYSDVIIIRTAPNYPKFNIIDNNKSLNITIENVSGAFYYEIYRSDDNKKYIKIKTLKNSLMYEDKKIEYGKTYYYKVRTCNSDGVCGNYSNIVSKRLSK